MSPERWRRARRVLAVHVGPGSVLALAPALRILRRGCPQACLALLPSRWAVSAAALLEDPVDEVLDCGVPGGDGGDLAPRVERIRDGRFDAAAIFTEAGWSPYPAAYACYLAGVRVRIGYSAEFGGRTLTGAFPPPPADTPPADRHRALLAAAGIAGAGSTVRVLLRDGEAPRAERGGDGRSSMGRGG